MHDHQDAIREAMRLAGTPAGKQLINLLQRQNSTQLQQAMSSASAGNYQQARNILEGLMQAPDVRNLLSQMEAQHGSDGR